MDSIITAAARRRRALAKKIGNGIAVLTAAPLAVKSRDLHYFPYRHDSYLYYLSGCREPHTALLLCADGGNITRECFLCPPHDAVAERWQGKRLTPRSAKRQLAFADTAAIDKLPTLLADWATGYEKLYCIPGADASLDAKLTGLARARRAGNRSRQSFPTTFVDVATLIDDMRLVKDKCEIALLSAACSLTAKGITAAMHAARTAKYECEVEAAITSTYRAGGGDNAFAPIVASGKNACILHYTQNNARLHKNKPLLVDSGCELAGYAGDITRTFPPGGEWGGAFADVYAVVLAAQKSAIAAAKPGATLQTLETAAVRRLARGLRALKLCRASVDAIIEKQHYRRFYMHKIGHWLGLDVHDVGAVYDTAGKPRRFVPGMVLTIEPGLYIPSDDDIPRAFAGIGVRIEDDILITKTGNEVLSAAAPKSAAAIGAHTGKA